EAAARDDRPLPWPDEVEAQVAVGGLDDRARGHADLQRRRARPVPEGPLAVPAARGLELPPAPERLQIAQRGVADEHDVGPAAAVAAVRPAARDVRLPPEGDAPVPARTGLDVDPRAIGEHGESLGTGRPGSADAPCVA